jgi:hypothetical protein
MSFDVVRAVADLDHRESAWRFITDFAAGWLRPIGAHDGYSDEELDATEARLGVGLPAAVREAYRMFGRRDDLTSANGTLLSPSRLDYDATRQLLVFRAANQGLEYYAVSLADPSREDPPVFRSEPISDIVEHSGTLNLADVRAALAAKQAGIDPDAEEADPKAGIAEENWGKFLDRFSLACVDMVLWEAVEAGPNADGRDLEDGEPESLVDGLTELPFPRHPDSRWYAGPDVLVRVDESVWVVVLGRDREALDAYREAHPGFWVDEDEG